MLSIAKIRGPDGGDYFMDITDYFGNERAEPQGWWWGKGANDLKITGTVNRRDLRNLLAGFSTEGNPLVQNWRQKDRPSGWDCVFLAPKPVSNIWAAVPELRWSIEKFHDEAVTEALNFLQEEAVWSRRGKGGRERERARAIVARFNHASSRNLDELLHTHCLFLAPVVREDGTTGARDSRELYRQKMTAGALYRAHLCYLLEKNLGVIIERERSWFGVQGVPVSLIRATSSRREEILEASAAYGHTAKANAVATLATREEKRHVTRTELFARWEKRAREHGLTPEYVQTILHRSPPRNEREELAKALERAEARVPENSPRFGALLLRYSCEEAQGACLPASLIRDGVRSRLQSRERERNQVQTETAASPLADDGKQELANDQEIILARIDRTEPARTGTKGPELNLGLHLGG